MNPILVLGTTEFNRRFPPRCLASRQLYDTGASAKCLACGRHRDAHGVQGACPEPRGTEGERG